MKNKIFLYICSCIFIFIMISVILLSADSPNYNIDGDIVYWENDYGKISVSPHTDENLITHTQYLNLTWYYPQTSLDFAIKLTPINDKWTSKRIFLWKNISHSNEEPIYGDVTFHKDCAGELDINYGFIDEDTGWCNDSRHFEWENNSFYYWEHDFNNYITNDSGVRIFYNETGIVDYHDKWYYDWDDISDLFIKIIYNDNSYYFIQDINFNEGETKKIKVTFDAQPNSNGKWELFIKRNSDTIQEALTSGDYVHLDPWWDSNWGKKKKIEITENSGINLKDYQLRLNISYNSDMNNDWSDVRFLDSSETHELDYFLWNTTSDYAIIDVQMNISASSSDYFYLYYGNPIASTTSNGENTYYYFEDFNDESGSKPSGWTDINGDGTYDFIDNVNPYEGTKFFHHNDTGGDSNPTGNASATTYDMGKYMFQYASLSGGASPSPLNFYITNLTSVDTANKRCVSAYVLTTGASWTSYQFQWNSSNVWRAVIDEDAGSFSAYDNAVDGVDDCGSFFFAHSNGAATGNSSIDIFAFANFTYPEPNYSVGSEISGSITVTLEEPINNYNSSLNDIVFNCTVASESTIVNVSLFENFSSTWHPNVSDTSGLATTYHFNVTDIPDGYYLWNCWANTSISMTNTSLNNRSITIDTTLPQISFNSNSTVNNTNSSQNWFYIYPDIIEINLRNISFYLYNYTSLVSIINYGDIQGNNYTSLNDGNYSYNMSIKDWSDNSGFSLTRYYVVDTTVPKIIFSTNTKINNSNISQNFIYVDINVIEANERNISFYLYNSTNTLFNVTNYTNGERSVNWTNLREGNYSYNSTIRDWVDNINSTSTNYIIIDTSIPNVTIYSPLTTQSSKTFIINSSISDNLEGIGIFQCLYNITRGGSVEVADTILNCSYDYQNATATVSSDADYVIHFFGKDYAGNTNLTNQSFTVSTSSSSSSSSSGGGGGGGTTIIVEEGGEPQWSISTETGAAKYEFQMVKGSSRTKNIVFENLGDESREISLFCEDSQCQLCQYVSFEETSFILPLAKDAKKGVKFTLDLPEEIQESKVCIFNIVAVDDKERKGVLTTQVNIGVFGSLSEILVKLGSKINIFGLKINGTLFLFLFILILTPLSYLIINVPLFKKKGLALNFIIISVSGFIFLTIT